jgi:hypothetical protein
VFGIVFCTCSSEYAARVDSNDSYTGLHANFYMRSSVSSQSVIARFRASGAGAHVLNGDASSRPSKAAGLQRVEELMRVVASAAEYNEEAAVNDLLVPLLRAVQGATVDLVAVHDRAVADVLREVHATTQLE